MRILRLLLCLCVALSLIGPAQARVVQAESDTTLTAGLVMADVHNVISGQVDALGGEGAPAHVIAHGLVGCAVAELQGADCGAGAVGGMVSAFYAGSIDRNGGLDEDQRAAATTNAEMIGAVAGYLVSGGKAENVSQAAAVSQSAFKNNYLYYAEALRKAEIEDILAECEVTAACSSAELTQMSDELAEIEAMDSVRDAVLRAACVNQISLQCATARSHVAQAADSYLAASDDRIAFNRLWDDNRHAIGMRNSITAGPAWNPEAFGLGLGAGVALGLNGAAGVVLVREAALMCGRQPTCTAAVVGQLVGVEVLAEFTGGAVVVSTTTGRVLNRIEVSPSALYPAPNAGALPSGYAKNANGTVAGPNGGTYAPAGSDLNGQQVYLDSGGRYYTMGGGTKTEVSNPASSPNVTITQQQAHHQGYVDDITGQLQSQGYTTTSGGFYSNCRTTLCYPDIIYSAPGSNRVTGIIEVKTGGAGPSTNQSTVYPQLGTGDAIPSSGFVRNWNQSNPGNPLTAGVPMNQQGYPNGIPVYQITAPGLNQ